MQDKKVHRASSPELSKPLTSTSEDSQTRPQTEIRTDVPMKDEATQFQPNSRFLHPASLSLSASEKKVRIDKESGW